MLDQTRGVLPKIPSRIAKFHLQIVENRLKFQSKILPVVQLIGEIRLVVLQIVEESPGR